MKLWLVRHAQPLIATGICYGQLDMPADDLANSQCARNLADVLPQGTIVITSPLQRCEQLRPVLIGLRPDLTFKTDPKLMEMDFGAWEARPWANIPKQELDAWTADFGNYPVGGSGETVGEFMARIVAAWDELPAAENVLWITHAGVVRAASLVAQGTRQIADAGQWPADGPAYGQWCTLDVPPATTGGRSHA